MTPIKLPPLPEADRLGPYSAEQMIEYALAMRKSMYESLVLRPSSATIIRYLEDHPDGGTLTEIYKACKLPPSTVHQFLAMRRGVYVDRWVKSNKAPGGYSAVYCLGGYPDAPKPSRRGCEREKTPPATKASGANRQLREAGETTGVATAPIR